jgi:hypothetical protein
MSFFLDVSDETKIRLKKFKKKDPELAKRILKKFDVFIEYTYTVLRQYPEPSLPLLL